VLKNACRAVGRIALYPAIAIVAFAIFSRVVIGAWLFGGGFFVPENKAIGDPMLAAAEVAWGVRTLSGRLLVAVAMAGFIIAFAIGLASKRRTSALLVLSLLAMAAIPWTAFVDGHPFRIRYMVPLIAIQAIGAGAAAGKRRTAASATAEIDTVVTACATAKAPIVAVTPCGAATAIAARRSAIDSVRNAARTS